LSPSYSSSFSFCLISPALRLGREATLPAGFPDSPGVHARDPLQRSLHDFRLDPVAHPVLDPLHYKMKRQAPGLTCHIIVNGSPHHSLYIPGCSMFIWSHGSGSRERINVPATNVTVP